jgi:hypothetical protein
VNEAFAESVTVSSGKREVVGAVAWMNPETCGSFGKPPLKLNQPKHGKLGSVWTSWVMDHGVCKGSKINGHIIFYTSQGGYRGSDKASYSTKYAKYVDGSTLVSDKTTLNITVK